VTTSIDERTDGLPLLVPSTSDRPVALHHGTPVLLPEFARHVVTVARHLPRDRCFMLNLCEDRYNYLVAYAAAQSREHTVLMPPSRAEQIVAEVEATTSGSYRWDDELAGAALSAESFDVVLSPTIAAGHVCMIGFTSGSTGEPKRFPKLWRSVHGSSACNLAAIRSALNPGQETVGWIVATVPPQHMYGMELSILLPLIGGMAVHAGRPLFPADIAQALAEVGAPRILVSTPVHLRALVESPQEFPSVSLIISATAPLDAVLARAIEGKLGGRVLEMFGSTETCVFASRHTAVDATWRLHAGVRLQPLPEGTLVNAPWYPASILLQDLVEMCGEDRFVVRGRNTDMIEVAGKRASLADLTRRLLAIGGVRDAVVFQPEPESIGTIRRVAALVVAPDMTAKQVSERLAPSVDPAFMPRPLVIVDALPRNELGKLPRDQLLKALRRS
jgi:acyl-coenzyme A synthetase/AMP-(fatty) acid ligase